MPKKTLSFTLQDIVSKCFFFKFYYLSSILLFVGLLGNWLYEDESRHLNVLLRICVCYVLILDFVDIFFGYFGFLKIAIGAKLNVNFTNVKCHLLANYAKLMLVWLRMCRVWY